MSENILNLIMKENEQLNNLQKGNDEKEAFKESNYIKCNIPWCRYCHLNPKILPLEERK